MSLGSGQELYAQAVILHIVAPRRAVAPPHAQRRTVSFVTVEEFAPTGSARVANRIQTTWLLDKRWFAARAAISSATTIARTLAWPKDSPPTGEPIARANVQVSQEIRPAVDMDYAIVMVCAAACPGTVDKRHAM